MALLVERWLGERCDAVVAGVQRLDESLDGPALPRRIAALEDEQEAGPELAGAELLADVEAQLEPATLEGGELLVVLLAPKAHRQIERVEATHRRRRYGAQPDGPKRSTLIRSTGCPMATSRSPAVLQKPVEPHTNAVTSPSSSSGGMSAAIRRAAARGHPAGAWRV